MFHKLLFLGPGGRTVYQGDVEGAKEYFDGMGYLCPANINPADHYMDVIGGVVKKNGVQSSPRALFDAWMSHERQANPTANGNCVDGSDIDIIVLPSSGMKCADLLVMFSSTVALSFMYNTHSTNICCLDGIRHLVLGGLQSLPKVLEICTE